MLTPAFWWLNIMARVRAGVPDSQAQAALDVSLATATRLLTPRIRRPCPTCVVLHVLTECLLLSVIGGVAGLMLAFTGRNLIPRLLENPWKESHDQLNLDCASSPSPRSSRFLLAFCLGWLRRSPRYTTSSAPA
jgi:hypothetical protein